MSLIKTLDDYKIDNNSPPGNVVKYATSTLTSTGLQSSFTTDAGSSTNLYYTQVTSLGFNPKMVLLKDGFGNHILYSPTALTVNGSQVYYNGQYYKGGYNVTNGFLLPCSLSGTYTYYVYG